MKGIGRRFAPLGRWVRRRWRIGAWLATAAYGLPGVIDDGLTWKRWVGHVLEWVENQTEAFPVERVTDLLTKQSTFWGVMAVGTCILLFEPIKFVLLRLYCKLRYYMTKTTSGPRMIDADEAARLVRASRWADSRWQRSRKDLTFAEALSRMMVSIDPKERERHQMFADWCRSALKNFENEGGKVESEDEEKRYDEVGLRRWLDERYEHDLHEAFGTP